MQQVTVQGESVPALGLGTWMLEGEACRRSVEQALDLGYRHIDTAQIYGNEEQVGSALRTATVDRGDLFVTTKVWNDHLAPADVVASTDESLRKLGTDYVDLLLIHWPVDLDGLPATLAAMQTLHEQGKARHLGVSNFTRGQVELAMEHARIFCNQVEYHPYLGQAALQELATKYDFLLTAYSPLARGEILDDPVLTEIGEAHGKSPVQVALRWLIDQDQVAAIPKATGSEHLQANADLFDFTLTDDDHSRIDALDRGHRLIDPFHLDWGANAS